MALSLSALEHVGSTQGGVTLARENYLDCSCVCTFRGSIKELQCTGVMSALPLRQRQWLSNCACFYVIDVRAVSVIIRGAVLASVSIHLGRLGRRQTTAAEQEAGVRSCPRDLRRCSF
jgi:hypothetical protein